MSTAIEVEDAVVARVREQLASAQRNLASLVERLPVAHYAARGQSAVAVPSTDPRSIPGHLGTMKVYEGTSAWWGRCVYGTVRS